MTLAVGIRRFVCVLAGCALASSADAEPSIWSPVDLPAAASAHAATATHGKSARTFTLSRSTLKAALAKAPHERNTTACFSQATLQVPRPDGTLAEFRLVEAPIMEPALASKFPDIKTYVAQGIDDPNATARFDLTEAGFHGQVLSPSGAYYVEPFDSTAPTLHVSYYKNEYKKLNSDFQCAAGPEEAAKGDGGLSAGSSLVAGSAASASVVPTPGVLRVYRLACAATGEYTKYFGGTVAKGLAAIVTAINRVNGIYETELGIRLVLVGNNDRIVYTNATTDPYSDGVPSTLLSQNQANLDSVIGSANYDIGHVFGTAGGGLAGVGVVCSSSKAYGETGIPAPVGDAFYVDYVAHEIGHQFGAHHTYNSSGASCAAGRFANAAYEPGSGSTIMAYAGVCGTDNIQYHSDPYFHSVSIEEITAFVATGAGAACATVTNTLNNAPTVYSGGSFIIPKGTPFMLTASGSDPDGDSLTYSWEERDLGAACSISAPDTGANPLFRSFAPETNACRVFPRLAATLAGTNSPGETPPMTSRTMQFRVTARDRRAGGGLIASADAQVIVSSNAGPFRFVGPLAATLSAGPQTITWDVAGTASAPINAANVDILLSTNGGQTFPIILASNTPNAGIKTIILPFIATSNGRFQIRAADNIFFCVSPANFSISTSNSASLAVVSPQPLSFRQDAPGSATLSWPAAAGTTYRVQYRDALASGEWTNLPPDITATSSVASFTTSTAGAPQRFFRLLIVP